VQGLDLNLASRPFKNDTLPWSAFALALTALVSMTVWNVQAYVGNASKRAEIEAKKADLTREMQELERRDREAQSRIDDFDLPLLAARAAKANEVIRWKSFSWTLLFNRLKEVQPWDVQMTTIRPVFEVTSAESRRAGEEEEAGGEDFDRVPVSVEGVAKTLQDFLEFERRLIDDPHFERVEPESTARDDNTGETVFRLRFLYDPRITADEGEAQAAAGAVAEAGPAAPPDDTRREAGPERAAGASGTDVADAALGTVAGEGEALRGAEAPPAAAADPTREVDAADAIPRPQATGPAAAAPAAAAAETADDSRGSRRNRKGARTPRSQRGAVEPSAPVAPVASGQADPEGTGGGGEVPDAWEQAGVAEAGADDGSGNPGVEASAEASVEPGEEASAEAGVEPSGDDSSEDVAQDPGAEDSASSDADAAPVEPGEGGD
jgi:hypothetical protein